MYEATSDVLDNKDDLDHKDDLGFDHKDKAIVKVLTAH
jgi:hypothetical protein